MALRGVRADLPQNSLQSLLHSKQRALQLQLASFQSFQLQARLTSLPPNPSPRLLLSTLRLTDHTSVIAEVSRFSPTESPQLLAARCRNYVRLGVDAIAIRTDEEASADGLADLQAACSALQVPVIRRDWFLHPLQIAETREVGAEALTLVYAVLQNGLPALQSYALSLGLDPIVEGLIWADDHQCVKCFSTALTGKLGVLYLLAHTGTRFNTLEWYSGCMYQLFRCCKMIVNLKDLEAVSKLGIINMYGINLSIKLSLPVPGLRQDVAKSLLRQLPDGALGIVGIMSIEEALEMKLAGANALYIRHEVWQGSKPGELQDEAFLDKLRDVLSE